jgi:hypothetical protein
MQRCEYPNCPRLKEHTPEIGKAPFYCITSHDRMACDACAKKRAEILIKLGRARIDGGTDSFALKVDDRKVKAEDLCEVLEFDEKGPTLYPGYLISCLWRATLTKPIGVPMFLAHLHDELETDEMLVRESGFSELQSPRFHEIISVDRETFCDIYATLHALSVYRFEAPLQMRYLDENEHHVTVGDHEFKLKYACVKYGGALEQSGCRSKLKWMPFALTGTVFDDVGDFDFMWAVLIDGSEAFYADVQEYI